VDDSEAAARAPLGDAVIVDPALTLRGLLQLLPPTDRPAPAPLVPHAIPLAVDTLTASQVHDILGPLFPRSGLVVTESMNGCATTTATPRNKRPHSSSAAPWIHARTPPRKAERVISKSNVANHVAIEHENGPRSDLRGPFLLVAGTGFEPATSGL
jgi:hypothetical protein